MNAPDFGDPEGVRLWALLRRLHARIGDVAAALAFAKARRFRWSSDADVHAGEAEAVALFRRSAAAYRLADLSADADRSAGWALAFEASVRSRAARSC